MSGEYRLGSFGDLIAQSCGVKKPKFDPKLASIFQPKKALKRLATTPANSKVEHKVALPEPAKPKVKVPKPMRHKDAADIRVAAKTKFQQPQGPQPVTIVPLPSIANNSDTIKTKVKKRKGEDGVKIVWKVEDGPDEAKVIKKINESDVILKGGEVENTELRVSKRKEKGGEVKTGDGAKSVIAQQNAPKEKDPELESRTVYVGNVPKDMGKKQLMKLFRQFGDVDTLRYRCGAPDKPMRLKKVAINKKEMHPDRNSVAAYIRYKSREEAEEAMRSGNGMQVQEHHLIVDMADNSAKKDNKKAIFVGNLHLKMHDDELWSFFEDCGKVESVRVIRDRDTGMGKGFGYVNFSDNASVELALQKDGTDLKNRALRISRCVKKLKNKDNPGSGSQTLGEKNSKNRRSQGKKKRGEVSEFAGDTTAEIGKFKRNSKKPNRDDLKKARVAKQLTSTGAPHHQGSSGQNQNSKAIFKKLNNKRNPLKPKKPRHKPRIAK